MAGKFDTFITYIVFAARFLVILAALLLSACETENGATSETATAVPTAAPPTSVPVIEPEPTRDADDSEGSNDVVTSTDTPVLPTPTHPTPLPTSTATATPTPTPTPTLPSAATPCNRAGYLTDVTIPDGTVLAPGTQFTKIWRLRNLGTCTWTSGYTLLFVDGDRLEGESALPLPGIVPPGYTVDIPVDLVAPGTSGTYIGLWQLRSPDGPSRGAWFAASPGGHAMPGLPPPSWRGTADTIRRAASSSEEGTGIPRNRLPVARARCDGRDGGPPGEGGSDPAPRSLVGHG